MMWESYQGGGGRGDSPSWGEHEDPEHQYQTSMEQVSLPKLKAGIYNVLLKK